MDPITKALHETWKNIVTNKTNKLNENVHFANVKQDIDAGNSELSDWHEDKYSGMWVKDDGIDRDANKANYDLDQFNQEMERKYGKTETGSYKTSLDDTDYKRKQDLEATQLASYRRQEEREVGEQERYTASVRKQEQEKRQNTARQQLMKERGEKIRKGEDPAQLSPGDVTARERQLERQEREKPFDFITKPKSIMSTPTPGKTPSQRPLINNNPIPPADYGKAKQAALDIINPMNPTRKPGLRLPNDFLSRTPKINNDVFSKKDVFRSELNSISIPKIYEERDAEGQMAMGELKVLAQKAQELAGMMKDDTQLEAWVQSKITKAKDYISSVHDYMNGNPDKID
jgi:hypothetical protein